MYDLLSPALPCEMPWWQTGDHEHVPLSLFRESREDHEASGARIVEGCLVYIIYQPSNYLPMNSFLTAELGSLPVVRGPRRTDYQGS